MASKKTTKKTKKKGVAKQQSARKEPGRRETSPALALTVAIIAVVVVLLGLLLVPRFLEQRQLRDDTYNNYLFKQWEDGTWTVNIEVNGVPVTVLLHHHPREVDSIPVDPDAVELVNALATMVEVSGEGRLFITMNPDAPSGVAIAGVEVAKVLGQKYDLYGIPTRAAFSRPKEGFGDTVPVVTCEDAVNDTFVIYIREHEPGMVAIPEGYPQCVVIQGADANETIKAADRFVYSLFNIIPAG